MGGVLASTLALVLALSGPARACPIEGVNAEAEALAAGPDDLGARIGPLLDALSCADGRVSPAMALDLHRARALAAYLARDIPGAVAALQSVVALSPDQPFAPGVIPEGHLLLRLAAEARARAPAPLAPLPWPAPDRLFVDGAPAASRPVDRAVVLQRIGPDGEIRWTGLLAPDDAPPWAPQAPPPADLSAPPPPDQASPSRGRALAWSAGGAAALSGGLWAAGLRDRAAVLAWEGRLDAGDGPVLDGLERRYQRANALGYAAQGATALALGLGVAAVVVRW